MGIMVISASAPQSAFLILAAGLFPKVLLIAKEGLCVGNA